MPDESDDLKHFKTLIQPCTFYPHRTPPKYRKIGLRIAESLGDEKAAHTMGVSVSAVRTWRERSQ